MFCVVLLSLGSGISDINNFTRESNAACQVETTYGSEGEDMLVGGGGGGWHKLRLREELKLVDGVR